jgi:2-polyprenyl-3-methyl-5-hydroxy-6-metoxy-1,4-benzoquinol methylase
MAFTELKARQSIMWGNGPSERITATLTDIHNLVIERLEARPGIEWLDAASGTGAVALLAAERGATVTGQDLAPA